MAGQYVAYTFFKVDPAWRRLPIEERNAGKEAFAEVVEDWADQMSSLRTYSVGGVRPDICDVNGPAASSAAMLTTYTTPVPSAVT